MRIPKPHATLMGICVALCAASGCRAPEPNVADILARYYEAMGGLERLREWRGLYARGKYVLVSQGGEEVALRAWYRAPDRKRYELTHGDGGTAVYAFDGENAWVWDPANGVTEPSLMPDEQAAQTSANADEYPFIDYAAKGHHVELSGAGEFDARPMFRIKLMRNNGAESWHLFDAANGREIKITTSSTREGRVFLYETVLRDFRSVEGIELPFLAESWVDGTLLRLLHMDSVEIDPPLDDSLFAFPGNPHDHSSERRERDRQ